MLSSCCMTERRSLPTSRRTPPTDCRGLRSFRRKRHRPIVIAPRPRFVDARPQTTGGFMGISSRMLIAVAMVLVCERALALEEHVGREAEKGDPARWYEPADTPQKRYEALKKEAGAALAQALQECRAQAAERKACEAAAR